LRPDRQRQDAEMGEEIVLATAEPNRQEDLQAENVPDPLEGEQTWPTEEELDEANAAGKICTDSITNSQTLTGLIIHIVMTKLSMPK